MTNYDSFHFFRVHIFTELAFADQCLCDLCVEVYVHLTETVGFNIFVYQGNMFAFSFKRKIKRKSAPCIAKC